MYAGSRGLVTAIAGLASLLLACGDEGPTSSGGVSGSGSVPFLSIGGGADEQGFVARRVADGGYLVVGLIGKPRAPFNDLHAVRTDAAGTILGQHPVRRGETHAYIMASVLTADGGIVAITTRSEEAILVKFASDGTVVWERPYGTRPGPAWYALCSAGDGFLVTVTPDVFAQENIVEFIWTNADGTLRTSDAWDASTRRVFSAAEAEDGSFVLAGSQWTTPSNLDLFVARTEPNSLTQDWEKTIGGEDHDYAMQVVVLRNDAVLFGAMDDPPGALENGFYYLMRLDPAGREVWLRYIDALGYVYGMTPTSAGGLAVAANGPEGPSIARLRGNGTVVWNRTVGGGSNDCVVLSIAPDADGYVVAGSIRSDETKDLDILLARLDAHGTGYRFPPHEPECIDPVPPPPPSDVVGTPRSYSVVHDTGRGMNAIWALSPSFVIAVGDSGCITRFDGDFWSVMTSNTTEELYDVFGFAEDDVFVAGRYGRMLHYDGASWAEMPSTATYLRALWGASPEDVWAGGVQLLHYDGIEWRDVTPKGWQTPIDMDGITATDIYSVGAAGVVQHFDGCLWNTVYQAPDRLLGITALPGPLVYAAGDDGLVVRYTPDVWETVDLGMAYDFTSAWARSKNDVFVAGTSGFAGPYVLYRFNGTSWSREPQASAQALLDVSGTTDGYVFGATSYAYIVQGTP